MTLTIAPLSPRVLLLQEDDPSLRHPPAGTATPADTLLQWQRLDEAHRGARRGAAGTLERNGGKAGAEGQPDMVEAMAVGTQSAVGEESAVVQRVVTVDSLDGLPSGLSQFICIPGFDERSSTQDGSGVPLLKNAK